MIYVDLVVMARTTLRGILLLSYGDMTMLTNINCVTFSRGSQCEVEEVTKYPQIRGDSMSTTQHLERNHLVYSIGH